MNALGNLVSTSTIAAVSLLIANSKKKFLNVKMMTKTSYIYILFTFQ